jgi:hypothetical protein
MWQSIGEDRPDTVLNIEYELWRVLFDLALLNMDPIERLKTAFKNLEPLLQGVPPQDLSWVADEGTIYAHSLHGGFTHTATGPAEEPTTVITERKEMERNIDIDNATNATDINVYNSPSGACLPPVAMAVDVHMDVQGMFYNIS